MFSGADVNLHVGGHGQDPGRSSQGGRGQGSPRGFDLSESQGAGSPVLELSANRRSTRCSAVSPSGTGHCVVPQQLPAETTLFLKVTRARLTAELVLPLNAARGNH